MGSDIPKENAAPASARRIEAGRFSLTESEQKAFKKWCRKHFLTSSEALTYRAAEEGKITFFKHLVSQGYGGKSLLKAAGKGKKTIVKNLVEAGVNINVQNGDGYTPLIKASAWGYTDVVIFLIKAGANLDIQNEYGNTALIIAVINGKRREIVRALIKAGADLDIRGKGGRAAVGYAEYYDNSYVRGVLVDALERKKAAIRRAEKPVPQANGWSVFSEGGREMVTLTSYDKQSGDGIKRIFDFNARSLITTTTSEGNQSPPTEKPFSEVEPDFLKQAEEKRKSLLSRPQEP